MLQNTISFLFYLFISLSPVFSVAADDLGAKIDIIVQKYISQFEFQGGVAIIKDGRILFQKGYGDAVIEFHVPNQINTKFRIGSVSKQFTAAAILLLQQDNLIEIQNPLSDYLEVPDAWKSITIHELLSHSAGLERDTPLSVHEFSNYHKLEELVQSIQQEKLAYPPGQGAKYSNAGYTVLAHLVEKTTQMEFQKFLKQRIFSPLQLNQTDEDHDSLIVPERAKGYFSFQNQLWSACCFDLSNVAGAGDLYSTLGDIAKWDESFYSEVLLNQASMDAMFSIHSHLPGGVDYGYGWVIDQWKGKKVLWHNGTVNGFKSDYSRYPDDHLAVILLSNRQDNPDRNYLISLRREIATEVWIY